jgi:hypothetical protein
MTEFIELLKDAHLSNTPVKDFLSDHQKKDIQLDLDKWKGKNSNKEFTEEMLDLFWILCEYDYTHGPGNWKDPFDPQADTMATWTYWFKENEPSEIKIIIKLFNDNGKFSICQFGVVSDYLFNFYDDCFL